MQTTDSPPTLQEWKNLYEASARFKALKCWDWMWDDHVFGVQDPESGMIGYCTVMGGLGEYFALAVYLGTEGLKVFLKIQSGKISPEELFCAQKCLTASFEDRAELEKPDLQVIKQLGFKFRGRNAWPLFRKSDPGYEPYFITTGHEARFLTAVLDQAIDVALRIRENEELLDAIKKGCYLVRVPRIENGQTTWRDEQLKPEPLKKAKLEIPVPNEMTLQKIKNNVSGQEGIWEADYFFFPAAISVPDGRLCYPLLFLLADHTSGMVLDFRLSEPDGHHGEFFQGQILNAFAMGNRLPEEILVGKKEAEAILKPIASKFKIRLKKVDVLDGIEAARVSLAERLMQA